MSPTALLTREQERVDDPATGARRRLWWFVAGALALLVVPLGMIAVAAATLFSATADQDETEVPSSPCLELADSTPVGTLTAEQTQNARVVVAAGQQAGVPARGLVVALATALQESGLRNLDYGDRDSVGLFQQRRLWGTAAERTDPPTSAAMFFTGGHDVDGAGPDGVEPGLLSIAGWQTMSVAAAAQAVQRSAFPTAYAKWEELAGGAVASITGSQPVSCTGSGVGVGGPDAPTSPCPAYRVPSVEAGLTPDLIAVLRCGSAKFTDLTSWGCLARSGHVSNSDHYTGRACDIMIPRWQEAAGVARGDEVAAYYERNARFYGVTYIIWRARIWNVARADEGWRPYAHPGGRTDPTALHMDHVHVSVSGSTGTYGWSTT